MKQKNDRQKNKQWIFKMQAVSPTFDLCVKNQHKHHQKSLIYARIEFRASSPILVGGRLLYGSEEIGGARSRACAHFTKARQAGSPPCVLLFARSYAAGVPSRGSRDFANLSAFSRGYAPSSSLSERSLSFAWKKLIFSSWQFLQNCCFCDDVNVPLYIICTSVF